jgi:glycosyltransferase involved in cell wall biosynthesis
VLMRIVETSGRVIVMAEKGRELLQTEYGVSPGKIEVIPHGIPDAPFAEPDAAKAKLGFAGKPVVLTFGLLSPNKGIEVMIDAMPSILDRQPDTVYVVLGATHPTLVRREGEQYRESLMARARKLGVENHVCFLNQFVERSTLLDYISMCDVYGTPYLHEAQMTSGTLAYSFGMGKAVVSTPYWHARELLADGRGVLVPFGNASVIGSEIGSLLTDDVRREAISRRAYTSSRSMTWERTAQRYRRNAKDMSPTWSTRAERCGMATGLSCPMPYPIHSAISQPSGFPHSWRPWQAEGRSVPNRTRDLCAASLLVSLVGAVLLLVIINWVRRAALR